MSLFGSLFSGVSGLGSQAQAMSAISNNIANVSTVGYKRVETAFGSQVTSQASSGSYSPGSVRAITTSTNTQQGAIQQTSNPTDISIAGNGFFVVQRSPDQQGETLFTRAGSFLEDSQGFLRNSTGFYLMGWPIDADGDLPAGQADPSSLVPVDVAFLGGLTKETTRADLSLNLDANQETLSYPLAAGTQTHFARGIRVFDSLGASQDIEFRFTKHTSPTGTAQSTIADGGVEETSLLTSVSDIEAGEEIVIDVDGTSDTFTVDASTRVQDFLAFINSGSTISDLALAKLDSETGQINIVGRNLSSTVTVSDGAIIAGSGAATALGFSSTPAPVEPNVFPGGASQLKTTPNPEGWWQLELVDASSEATLMKGSINFTEDGELNSKPDLDGERKLSLSGIEWGNGSSPQDITIEIGNIGQFAGAYNVIYTEQNGAELGLRTGVEIDDEGIVSARFSNGQLAALYKIPLATFTNANGLEEVTGNAFVAGSESGSFNLREPGRGGAGLISGASLEASNVDLADEFSKIIIVQRAYSANTKIITTANEMTEELLRIK